MSFYYQVGQALPPAKDTPKDAPKDKPAPAPEKKAGLGLDDQPVAVQVTVPGGDQQKDEPKPGEKTPEKPEQKQPDAPPAKEPPQGDLKKDDPQWKLNDDKPADKVGELQPGLGPQVPAPKVSKTGDLLLPWLLLVGVILIGALILYLVKSWQTKQNEPLSIDPNDQLAKFRESYESGEMSEEEFKRVKAILTGKIRNKLNTGSAEETPRPASPKSPKGSDLNA